MNGRRAGSTTTPEASRSTRGAARARLLPVWAMGCGLLLPGAGRAEPDLVPLVSRLEATTVALIAFQPRRRVQVERYDILGGGCFVTATGHVLTADHVLRRIIQPEGHVSRAADLTRLAIGWLPDAARTDATIVTNRSGRQIRVLRRDPARDLALLRVQTDAATPVVISEADAPVGADVVFLGFPFGSALGFRPLVNRGTIAGRRHLPDRGPGAEHVRGYILDGGVHPGHSGAPVFDTRTGQLVGLVQRRLAETIPVAIASSEILTFLEDAGVSAQTAHSASP